MLRRRRVVCARSKRNPWRFCVANLWGLREPLSVAGIFKIGSVVGVVLTRKRYPKRAPKRSSAPPIKSSVRDALKSIQSPHNRLPENDPRQPGAMHSAGAFFLPRSQLRRRRSCVDLLDRKSDPKTEQLFSEVSPTLF